MELEFGHSGGALVHHPDIGAIKGNSVWGTARRESAGGRRGRPNDPRAGPIARPQLGHSVAALVCHPDVGAIEGHTVYGEPGLGGSSVAERPECPCGGPLSAHARGALRGGLSALMERGIGSAGMHRHKVPRPSEVPRRPHVGMSGLP